MSLTIQDIERIKLDAHKTVQRQFRDAIEDYGWEPTATPEAGTVELVDESTELDDATASIKDLRSQAKDLGISAGGSKDELTQRIADAQKGTE
jgi:SAP domain-containing new25